MTETPAEVLQRAATLMRERAEAATPGPWERPLDTRYKNIVIAALPDGEQGQYEGGCIPAEWSDHKGIAGRYAGQRERVSVVSAAIWSIGGFTRKRSGRDLDHIAAMHPLVALAVAGWLDAEAGKAEMLISPRLLCRQCGGWIDDENADSLCHCWDSPLAVARAYLNETAEVPA